jgi:Ca2+-binding RTX toxin-like protein
MAKVLFGTNAADADLQGGSQDDRLYGRDGNDVLRGEGGNDWLEGGADNDVLYGDDGNDTLLGGAGNDTLEGGNGNDWLYGGAGLDTYEFSAGHGNDVVIDSDGQGVIRYDGATIAGASIGPDGVGRDERFTYTLIDKGDGTHDLLIQRNGTSDSITIRNWIEGGFGFETTEQEEAPEFDRQFHGDYRPPIVGVEVDLDVGPGDPGYNRYAWDRVEWIEGSPILQGGIHHPTHSDAIRGTAGSDQIFTYGGNDWVAGHEGDDHIEGGVGKDVISGGPGADRIYGGDGDDLISSSMFIGTRWALPPANQSYADYQPYEQHGWTVPGAEVFVGEERFGVWWQEPNEDLVNLGIARNTHDNDWVDAGAGNDNVWGSLVS